MDSGRGNPGGIRAGRRFQHPTSAFDWSEPRSCFVFLHRRVGHWRTLSGDTQALAAIVGVELCRNPAALRRMVLEFL